MQIVIDMDEELYKRIKKNCDIYEEEIESVAFSIIGGTPLPKGHGRLIDADALGEELHRYTEAPYLYALKVFNDAPTIIGADKEVEE
jgi:hypothetical protein